MSTVIIIATIVIALALIVWFFIGQNPAQSDNEPREPLVSESDRFYSKVDRPAGPDAEPMDPDTMLEGRRREST